jgi:predicted dithiol-disulfide oxidoreductase (DUF899 family)
MSLPKVATRDEWLAARTELLAKEKDLTRLRDALSTERRNLPMVEIETDYVFDGPDGTVRLIDMFEGRRQLIIYHFMFDPEWDDGCPSCTAGTDELSPGFFEHLHTRDTSYAMVSRAPLEKLEQWKAKKGWHIPWYSSFGTDFNYDFGVTIDESVAPAEYNFRTKAEFEPGDRPSSRPTSPSRCPVGAASSRSTAAYSIPTPSTREGSRAPAAPTTSSTSPPSGGRRTGRNPRAAQNLPGRPGPTSRRERGLAAAGAAAALALVHGLHPGDGDGVTLLDQARGHPL